MREKVYQQKEARAVTCLEVYRLRYVDCVEISSIMEKTGISRRQVYNLMSKFERDNPQLADQMKKRGKDASREDYRILQEEVISLKKSLARERLRADFYEEMVAFGKEVYGIDLKKAGTK